MKFEVGQLVQIKEAMWREVDAAVYGFVKGHRYVVTAYKQTEYPAISLAGYPNGWYDAAYFELATIKPKRYAVGDKVISTRDTPEVPEGFVGYVVENDQSEYAYAVKDAGGYIEYFNEDELELLSASGPALKITDFVNVKPYEVSDAVNSPRHYAVFDDIEAIEIIARSMTKEMFKGYCFGNLLKYRLRAGGKDDVNQELGKAEKYKELYEKYKEFCQ